MNWVLNIQLTKVCSAKNGDLTRMGIKFSAKRHYMIESVVQDKNYFYF